MIPCVIVRSDRWDMRIASPLDRCDHDGFEQRHWVVEIEQLLFRDLSGQIIQHDVSSVLAD